MGRAACLLVVLLLSVGVGIAEEIGTKKSSATRRSDDNADISEIKGTSQESDTAFNSLSMQKQGPFTNEKIVTDEVKKTNENSNVYFDSRTSKELGSLTKGNDKKIVLNEDVKEMNQNWSIPSNSLIVQKQGSVTKGSYEKSPSRKVKEADQNFTPSDSTVTQQQDFSDKKCAGMTNLGKVKETNQDLNAFRNLPIMHKQTSVAEESYEKLSEGKVKKANQNLNSSLNSHFTQPQSSVTKGSYEKTATGKVKSTNHDLKTFFDSPILPLSLAYLDHPLKSLHHNLQVYPGKMSYVPSTSGNQPSRVAASTAMNNIFQAIRDLKLSIAEMDEKLEKVVQKLFPPQNDHADHGMKRGVEWIKQLFRLGRHNIVNHGEPAIIKRGEDAGIGLRFN